MLGRGRYGIVYRAHWHGEVAVKQLHIAELQQEKALELFKNEVAVFHKTRHDNLVLFMGVCLHPFAIVTSLCKGLSLYTHIHMREEKFNINRIVLIAQQIAQGMGYLHARSIIHKDLRSKNIFIENGKVIITDFGLFNFTKVISRNNSLKLLCVPRGWLYYLAPEIMRKLHSDYDMELSLTKATDIYSFGTIWYELLCGEWPFEHHPAETIIWQVGNGIRFPLSNLQASKDVKDILVSCWAYNPQDRLEFSIVLKALETVPRKRLTRSPSHPVHFARSVESAF